MESVYPAGMLDRDQRTAKIRLCQCRCSDMEVPNRTSSFTSDASTKISSIFSSIVFNKKRTKFSYLIWKKGYLIHTYNFPRVKNVVLVLVYLTLTMMNSASTAPAPKDDKWWESPCGSSPEPAEPLSTTPPQEFNKWHLSDLLIQAQYNLIQANHLKDSFKGDYSVNIPDRQPYAWLSWVSRWRLVYNNVTRVVERLRDIYFLYSKCAVTMKLRIEEETFEWDPEFKEAYMRLTSMMCYIKRILKLAIADLTPFKNPYDYIPKDDIAPLKDNERDKQTIRDYAFMNYYIKTSKYVVELLKVYESYVNAGAFPLVVEPELVEQEREKRRRR
ncbi:uncharacterized protein LOC126888265 isoform X3 [Diabrotica virgifera virgifera]|uniref:Uncharacterized protein n=2 Tax=Diabrotica virgifera virgifera TaxID=50390 RepID=A0ABM5KQ65_DIAVI|nr:uncharacterized protein LOC126888265 isoform X3 [Diabrotica virgifera virgifera]